MRALRKHCATQTIVEELFNAFTHGVGIVLSIAGLITLLVLSVAQADSLKIISSAVYGGSLIIMYTASTLYHSHKVPHIKRVLRVLDHSSIYILIAGTYTPFTLVTMNGAWGWSLFVIIWSLALAGVVFKIFYTGRFQILSVAIYLIMGWLIVIAAEPFLESLPIDGVIWVLLGGLSYTFGVVFFIIDEKYHYTHAIWHLFVLAGSIFQFFAVLFYVI